MRAVIDTNIIVAAMKSNMGASHAVLMAIYSRRFMPVLSVPLLMEYEEVCKRPGLVPNLTHARIDAILDLICQRSHHQRIFFN